MILLSLLQEGEHGFELAEAIKQFAQFIAWFGIFGPLGFRWVVMRGLVGSRMQPERELDSVDQLRDGALRGAARIGLYGSLLLLVDLFPWNARNAIMAVAAIVAALAYAVALRRPIGWVVALLAGLVLTFRTVLALRWGALVNPIHMTAAGLWIGTLFVVVSAGLPAILRAPLGERRGAFVTEMIARFSPLALVSSGILVLTGVITAWLHLGALSELWSSSYGITLIVKLVFVAMVVTLGAWNWRRMSPRLGTEEAAHALRRSATSEVLVAGAVLIVTAVLVSLPSPAERHRERRGRPPAIGAPAGAPASAVPATTSGAAARDDD